MIIFHIHDNDDTDAYDDDDDLVARDSIGRVRPSLSPSWQLCRLYWGGQPCQDAAWDGDILFALVFICPTSSIPTYMHICGWVTHGFFFRVVKFLKIDVENPFSLSLDFVANHAKIKCVGSQAMIAMVMIINRKVNNYQSQQ